MADRTKLWIAESLKRLLVEKRLEDIRVTEICREAQIERATFYYHFRDKYDLMAWIFVQASVQVDLLSVESMTRALKRMRKDKAFYKRAYEDNSQSPMVEYILEYYVAQYSDIVKEKLGTETLDEQMLYSIRLYTYGTLGMTQEWVLKDATVPAETYISMMVRSMPEPLSAIFFPETREKADIAGYEIPVQH